MFIACHFVTVTVTPECRPHVYIVAPVDKMAEVLRKTTKEAKDMISKVSTQYVDKNFTSQMLVSQ